MTAQADDRTKPIFDRTLSVDRPLFAALKYRRISRYFAFFWEFRGISRKYLNFAGPRPREISEALLGRFKLLEGGKGVKTMQKRQREGARGGGDKDSGITLH